MSEFITGIDPAPVPDVVPGERSTPGGDAMVRIVRNSSPTAERWHLLSPDEKGRADGFKFERDRNAFITARSELRRMLGERLGHSPADLRFAVNAWGKPHLAKPHQGSSLDFSVAHSGDTSLIALAAGRRVGVDLELRRPVDDMNALARRLYDASVAEILSELDEPERSAAFLRLWTAGEAYAKALGLGLAGLGGAVPVGFADRGAVHVCIAGGPPARSRRQWKLAALELGSRYIGAIAIECDERSASQCDRTTLVRYEAGP